MRIAAHLSYAIVLFFADGVVAQTVPSLLDRNDDYKFAVIFPSELMARDITYVTKNSSSVPARQFHVEQGGDRYNAGQIAQHSASRLRHCQICR
jgi:hypothetical protein